MLHISSKTTEISTLRQTSRNEQPSHHLLGIAEVKMTSCIQSWDRIQIGDGLWNHRHCSGILQLKRNVLTKHCSSASLGESFRHVSPGSVARP